MTGALRTAILTAWPHCGQRRARDNARDALRTVRVAAAERAEAERAFASRELAERRLG